MPESNFQSDSPIVMPFLSQAQSDNEPQPSSAFTECIRLAALCGQSLSHYQQSIVEQKTHDSFSQEFWARHQRLETDIVKSVEKLSKYDPCANLHLDSMPLLTHMTAQAAIITMYKAAQQMHTQSDMSNHEDAMEKVSLMALPAVQRIAALSIELTQLSYFQVRIMSFIVDFSFHR